MRGHFQTHQSHLVALWIEAGFTDGDGMFLIWRLHFWVVGCLIFVLFSRKKDQVRVKTNSSSLFSVGSLHEMVHKPLEYHIFTPYLTSHIPLPLTRTEVGLRPELLSQITSTFFKNLAYCWCNLKDFIMLSMQITVSKPGFFL